MSRKLYHVTFIRRGTFETVKYHRLNIIEDTATDAVKNAFRRLKEQGGIPSGDSIAQYTFDIYEMKTVTRPRLRDLLEDYEVTLGQRIA